MIRALLERLTRSVRPVQRLCALQGCGRRAVGELVVLLSGGGRRLVPGCRMHIQALSA